MTFLKFLLLIFPTIIYCQSNDEFSIYSDLIKNNFSKPNKIIILQKETSSNFKDINYKFLKVNFKKLAPETFKDFINKNKKESIIQNLFNKDLRINLIEKIETHELFKKHTGWDDFYKKYKNSDGILEFSRIGFNKNKTQAFFYYSKSSGFLNASGIYTFYEKKNGKWIYSSSFMAWIS